MYTLRPAWGVLPVKILMVFNVQLAHDDARDNIFYSNILHFYADAGNIIQYEIYYITRVLRTSRVLRDAFLFSISMNYTTLRVSN